ncbi:MAG: hypothetical protein AAGJ35_12415, partial [Myxococcota bacterium]
SLQLALLPYLAQAAVHFNSSTRVTIPIPANHYNADGEAHVTAPWGFTSEFGMLQASVVTSNKSFCDWGENDTLPEIGSRPFILLSRASSACTSVDQVRASQEFGAAAALLAEPKCHCDHPTCDSNNCMQHEDRVEFMAPDGSSGDISIPSFSLNLDTANQIFASMKNNTSTLVQLEWGLPTIDELEAAPKLHWSLWTTSHDENSMDLETYKNFKLVAESLQDETVFDPHFVLIDGSLFACATNPDHCRDMCTNHGRYCAMPAHTPDGIVHGKYVVGESLRRICVARDNPAEAYWKYVVYFKEQCGDHYYADAGCQANAIKHAGVKPETLESCIQDSGGLTGDQANHFLQQELKLQHQLGLTAVPAVVINSHIHEQPNSFGLFEGLCRHFFMRNLTTTPDLCFTCGTCPNILGCIASEGKCPAFEKP